MHALPYMHSLPYNYVIRLRACARIEARGGSNPASRKDALSKGLPHAF